mgnify:CR=1 FL=1
MIVGLLLFLIFALVFTTIQTLLLRKEGSDSKTYAKEQLENLKKGRHFQEFVLRKQIKLKKYGADIFVRDGILILSHRPLFLSPPKFYLRSHFSRSSQALSKHFASLNSHFEYANTMPRVCEHYAYTMPVHF